MTRKSELAEVSPGDREFLMHLQAWVIQDGNYPDLAVGDRVRHAVGFEPAALSGDASLPLRTDRGLWREGNIYRAAGDLVFRDKGHVLVADFGVLLAFSTAAHRWKETVGDRLMDSVRLIMDHYEYREIYSKVRGIPSLEYDWYITGLWRLAQATDIPTHAAGGEAYVAVTRTNALSDSGGVAEYLVQSRALS